MAHDSSSAGANGWTERFTKTVAGASGSAVPGRTELDAHLDAIVEGTAGAPEQPPLESSSEDQPELSQTAWRAWLRHGELLAGLGLREREGSITIVQLRADDLAIESAGGEPLLVIAEREAILANPALLDALVGRELIVVGDAGSLLELLDGLGDRAATLRFVQVLIDRLPSMPAAARLLHERYRCPVGEAMVDPGGGWIGIATRHGEPLAPIRPREDVHVIGRTGDRVEANGWGMLATRRSGGRSSLGVWARLQRRRTGEPGIVLGVPETPLESHGELRLNVQDLHSLLGALPVFAYSLRLCDGDGTLLQIATTPGVDLEQAKLEISDAIARGLVNLPIEFCRPGVEFPPPRIHDLRVADLMRLVEVVWAGAEHSEERRGAWRTALSATGMTASHDIRLIDAGSGEPITDPLVCEVLASLIEEGWSDCPLELRDEWTIAIGEPNDGCDADAWLLVLDADETREGMLIAGQNRDAVARIAALFSTGTLTPGLEKLTISGVQMAAYSRPMLAAGRPSADHVEPILVDPQRCTGAGDCVRVCPTRAITLVEQRPVIDATACVRCHLCSERCDQLALRPYLDGDAYVDGRMLVREADKLARIRDRVRPRLLDGKLADAPALQVAPATIRRKPTVVLGLATVTLMEHAAALLIDGQLVAGIEEERLARVRHYSFQHPQLPGASLSSEPCMRLEEAWPQRSIAAVL
ncbi:MAG TPA: 4Fe-4S dicluster domain-containing protein, partial [Enhygromyxa sp.]|nr:4Fe-4S dicluster domain-containing protein [Enhygromyxa sp.]